MKRVRPLITAEGLFGLKTIPCNFKGGGWAGATSLVVLVLVAEARIAAWFVARASSTEAGAACAVRAETSMGPDTWFDWSTTPASFPLLTEGREIAFLELAVSAVGAGEG